MYTTHPPEYGASQGLACGHVDARRSPRWIGHKNPKSLRIFERAEPPSYVPRRGRAGSIFTHWQGERAIGDLGWTRRAQVEVRGWRKVLSRLPGYATHRQAWQENSTQG